MLSLLSPVTAPSPLLAPEIPISIKVLREMVGVRLSSPQLRAMGILPRRTVGGIRSYVYEDVDRTCTELARLFLANARRHSTSVYIKAEPTPSDALIDVDVVGVRVINILRRMGISSWGQLSRIAPESLMFQSGFGLGSMRQLRRAMKQRGITFGRDE